MLREFWLKEQRSRYTSVLLAWNLDTNRHLDCQSSISIRSPIHNIDRLFAFHQAFLPKNAIARIPPTHPAGVRCVGYPFCPYYFRRALVGRKQVATTL